MQGNLFRRSADHKQRVNNAKLPSTCKWETKRWNRQSCLNQRSRDV